MGKKWGYPTCTPSGGVPPLFFSDTILLPPILRQFHVFNKYLLYAATALGTEDRKMIPALQEFTPQEGRQTLAVEGAGP